MVSARPDNRTAFVLRIYATDISLSSSLWIKGRGKEAPLFLSIHRRRAETPIFLRNPNEISILNLFSQIGCWCDRNSLKIEGSGLFLYFFRIPEIRSAVRVSAPRNAGRESGFSFETLRFLGFWWDSFCKSHKRASSLRRNRTAKDSTCARLAVEIDNRKGRFFLPRFVTFWVEFRSKPVEIVILGFSDAIFSYHICCTPALIGAEEFRAGRCAFKFSVTKGSSFLCCNRRIQIRIEGFRWHRRQR